MSVSSLLDRLERAGVRVDLADGGRLAAVPRSALTPELRALIRINHDQIVRLLERIEAMQPSITFTRVIDSGYGGVEVRRVEGETGDTRWTRGFWQGAVWIETDETTDETVAEAWCQTLLPIDPDRDSAVGENTPFGDDRRNSTFRTPEERSDPMKLSELFPSKYAKAADLDEGPVQVTIRAISEEDVGDGAKPVVHFDDYKPLVLNLTNGRTIASICGSEDSKDWVGHSVELFATTTDFRGKLVPCVRIRRPRKTESSSSPDAN